MILKELPGEFRDTARPNWLTPEAIERDPSLNFLKMTDILDVVEARLNVQWGGIVQGNRIKRNLLSSQPLCFNLFGYLSTRLDEAGAILREAMSLDIHKVTTVKLEYSPFADRRIEWPSGSAFDAFVDFEESDGTRSFLGIECKYHEDLSRQSNRPGRADGSIYRLLTDAAESRFVPGAGDALNATMTCQLWYNACLVVKTLLNHGDWRRGYVVLMSCAEDRGAQTAFDQFLKCLTGDTWAFALSYERLVAIARALDGLREWADQFHLRYLDFGKSVA